MEDYTPLYIQIKNHILEKIKNGELKPGDKIPSEKQLKKKFNVSRITVTNAIKELANDDIVYRKRGKGTFIKKRSSEENILSFVNFNIDTSITNHETFEKMVIEAPDEIADKLNIKRKDKVIKLTRIRKIGDKPLSLEYTYIPSDICPQLLSMDIKNKTIHEILETECNITLINSRISVLPELADNNIAELLQVDVKTPLLFWERLTYDDQDNIVEFSEVYDNANRQHRYFIEFKK